jgi:hypothetical protein
VVEEQGRVGLAFDREDLGDPGEVADLVDLDVLARIDVGRLRAVDLLRRTESVTACSGSPSILASPWSGFRAVFISMPR